MKKTLLIILLLAVFSGPAAPVFAEDEAEPSAAAIMFDVVFVRPLGLVSMALGSTVFVLGLPFSVPAGSVKTAGKKLVAEPFKFTFARPVGEIYESGYDNGCYP